MIDRDRILRPLAEGSAAIDRLTTYETTDELRDALRESWRAFERALRQLLRSHPSVPDELRLSALSSADLPVDRLIPALRSRNLVSLELAGKGHAFEQSVQRGEHGSIRPADADAALAAIAELRREVLARAEAPPGDDAHPAERPDSLDLTAYPVAPGGGRSNTRLVAGVILALAALAAVVLVLRGGGNAMADGVSAFDTEDYGVAEREFRRALDDDPENVTARLYLARIFRIQERREEAAEVLHEASRISPNDADVRRELGYLFFDLNRPESAAGQFRIAQELEPGDDRNWIGLVRALRAAGDPEAERVLERAPANVRAALRSGEAPPDTL
ncbi:MAG: tetratricopeptide repeat protein [Longimicrobiales bacterium]